MCLAWQSMKASLSSLKVTFHTLNPVFRVLFLFKIYLFLLKTQIQRENERQIESPFASQSWADPRNQEPPLGLSMWVQCPKTSGHPLLIYQATGREPERKWSVQDTNQHSYGIPVYTRVRPFPTRLLHQAPLSLFLSQPGSCSPTWMAGNCKHVREVWWLWVAIW